MKEIFRSLYYELAQERAKTAYAEYNYASTKLELCEAKERNCELASQVFMYVAKGELYKRFGEITDREREIGLAFARYAVIGRTDED